MKHKAILGLAIGGLLSLAPIAAFAEPTLYVNYSGTIASGTDGLGLFGTAGSSLAGASYAVNYVFDVGTPGALTSNTADTDLIYGGSFYSAPSPLTSVTVTVGGVSHVMAGNTASDAGIFRALGNYLETSAIDTPFTSINGSTVAYFDAIFGTYLTHPVGLGDTSISDPAATGGITFSDDPTAYAGFFNFVAIGGTSTTAKLESGGSLTGFFAVPEPATWLMMIAGFGAVGFMQRRTARRVRVSYAMA